MGRSHLLAGTCVALTVFYLGCAAKPKAAARRSNPRAAAVADATAANPQAAEGQRGQREVPTVTAAEATPTTVAQHAEVYAQNLESLLAKRRGAAQPAPVSKDAAPAAPEAAPEPAAAGANAAAEVAPSRPAPPQKPAEVETEIPASATALAMPASKSLATQPPKAPATPAPAPATVAPAAVAPAAVAPAAVAPAAVARTPGVSAAASKAPASATTPADALPQQLATRAKEYPRDAAAQLDFQLLQFLRDESVPDLAPLATLPAEDRELLTTLLDGLSNFRNGLRAEANMLQSKKVSPLLEMGDRLRGQGELTLPTTALCTKVERFGVYEPMEPAQFKSNTNNEAVLYCEVANFSSQLGDTRQWETRLKHECVLYSESGLAVWQDKTDAVTDASRNRRHDFYVVKRLRLPPLPVGRYLLKVSVTDLQVSRVAEATVPISVVAP